MEGLEWASGYLKANEKTTLYSSYNSSKGTVGGTKTTVSKGQYMTYIGTYGKYYKVKLYTGSGNSFSTNGKVGYIINSNDVLRKNISTMIDRGQTLTNQLSVARRISQRAFQSIKIQAICKNSMSIKTQAIFITTSIWQMFRRHRQSP